MSTEVKYDALRYYLNEKLECFPDNDELKRILVLAEKTVGYEANKGIRFIRTKSSFRELVFYEQWKKENIPDPSSGFGYGLLQDLFIEGNVLDLMGDSKVIEIITERDRRIVATIIQWLGSNVGMGFLHEALRRCNMQITEIKR